MSNSQNKGNAGMGKPRVDNEGSKDFLLAEYERLRDIRTEYIQKSSRRFEFYITITTASVGTLLLTTQSQGQHSVPKYFIDLFALGILGYGVITFMNITFASIFHLQIIQAVKEIQKYFIERDVEVHKHLYFNTPTPPTPSNYKFLGVLARGMGGGSEKSVVALVNGALATYLTITLFDSYLAVKMPQIGTVTMAFVIFFISCILHAVYVTSMYKYGRSKL